MSEAAAYLTAMSSGESSAPSNGQWDMVFTMLSSPSTWRT